jgi:hypothetical protein
MGLLRQRVARGRVLAMEAQRRARIASSVLRQPLWGEPGGPISPIPGPDDISRALVPAADPHAIELRTAEQIALMTQLSQLEWEVPFDPTPGWRYHNSWFFDAPDAAVYQALLRTLQPARIVESGSGFSSALALDTSDRWLPELEFVFIDPNPARLNELLTADDRRRCQVIAKPVQDVDLSRFETLGPGDILFCDTDHFAKAGSEVNWLLFNVLPQLRPGVIVHIHDVFWPFEYPAAWLHDRRAYNELYLVRAFLMYNQDFEVVLFNDWIWQHHRELFKDVPSAWGPPGSLWLRKTG